MSRRGGGGGTIYIVRSENKGADQLHGYLTAQLTCAFDFPYAKRRFSHDAAHIMKYNKLLSTWFHNNHKDNTYFPTCAVNQAEAAMLSHDGSFEPCHEKIGFLYMRKQRHRSASR